jgi:hypothetical protein
MRSQRFLLFVLLNVAAIGFFAQTPVTAQPRAGCAPTSTLQTPGCHAQTCLSVLPTRAGTLKLF